MKNVLMVCLGNICRSPLAEGILKSKVSQKKVFVDSAGTGGWHVGSKPDKRSIEVARNHNIDIAGQRCRKFIVSDFDDFDLILVMDNSNYHDVTDLARDEFDIQKVKLILEYSKDKNVEVPDPYYGGADGFEYVYQMLNEACKIVANEIYEK